MNMHPLQCIVACISLSLPLHAEMFGGVDFPGGSASFADRVHAVTAGNPGPQLDNFTNSRRATGEPDYSGGATGTGAYTLGHGGSLTLEFSDNRLVGDGTTAPDLYIFEVGPFTEPTFVFISERGRTFIPVGRVSGATSSLDIDPFVAANKSYRFVRLVDDTTDSSNGLTPGADIDAVGAIASRKPTVAECNRNSQGRLANMKVVTYDIEDDLQNPNIAYFLVFSGTIAEGYCYTIEFSLNHQDWFSVREGGAEDFQLRHTSKGGYQTSILVGGTLFQQLGGDAEKIAEKGFFRLKIRDKDTPGGD